MAGWPEISEATQIVAMAVAIFRVFGFIVFGRLFTVRWPVVAVSVALVDTWVQTLIRAVRLPWRAGQAVGLNRDGWLMDRKRGEVRWRLDAYQVRPGLSRFRTPASADRSARTDKA